MVSTAAWDELNMDTLREMLQSYKNITLQLIDCAEAEDYDKLGNLLNTRGNIISEIDKLNYQDKEFRQICDEMDIGKFENKLNSILENKYSNIKEQLRNIINGRKINRSYRPGYNKNKYVDSIFISKKI